MINDNAKIALIFKALCDENRVSIVKLLQNGEMCACNVSDTLGIAQSKLSYHMKILCESGLVQCRYMGKWSHYKINAEGSKIAMEILKELTTENEQSGELECVEAI